MPSATNEERLTASEIEQIKQSACDAAAAVKRALTIIDPLCPADPRFQQAAQVFIESYGELFGVSEERTNAIFTQMENAVRLQLASRRQDS